MHSDTTTSVFLTVRTLLFILNSNALILPINSHLSYTSPKDTLSASTCRFKLFFVIYSLGSVCVHAVVQSRSLGPSNQHQTVHILNLEFYIKQSLELLLKSRVSNFNRMVLDLPTAYKFKLHLIQISILSRISLSFP